MNAVSDCDANPILEFFLGNFSRFHTYIPLKERGRTDLRCHWRKSVRPLFTDPLTILVLEDFDSLAIFREFNFAVLNEFGVNLADVNRD